MKKKVLFCILLVLVLFTGGCLGQGTVDATSVVKSLPQVQEFLKEHPNAEMSAVRWSDSYIHSNIDKINEKCRPVLKNKAYYKVDVEEKGVKMTAWVSSDDYTVVCIYKKGEEITTTTITQGGPGGGGGGTTKPANHAPYVKELYYSGGRETGDSGAFYCEVSDQDQDDSELETYLWVGACEWGDCESTMNYKWYWNGIKIDYYSMDSFRKRINSIPWSPGTVVGATCRVWDKEGEPSEWEDSYPLFTVVPEEPSSTTTTTEVSCLTYCQGQTHINCTGHWDTTGEYPDCNCQWVCEESTTSTSSTSTSTTVTTTCPPLWDVNHCEYPDCLCPSGEGDCDLDSDCQPGLICCKDSEENDWLNVGEIYGCPSSKYESGPAGGSSIDVCLTQSECDNLVSENSTTTTTISNGGGGGSGGGTTPELSIDNINCNENIIYVKNTGSLNISSTEIGVYVNDTLLNNENLHFSPTVIEPNSTMTINTTAEKILDKNEIKISLEGESEDTSNECL